MEKLFLIEGKINQIYTSLKKFSKFKPTTRQAKIVELITLKDEARNSIKNTQLSEEVRVILGEKYRQLCEKVSECLKLLKRNNIDEETLSEHSTGEEEIEESEEENFTDFEEE